MDGSDAMKPRREACDPRLPAILGDNMVLQAGRPVPIWGWANPGQAVTVRFREQTLAGVAGADGAWRVTFPPMSAGGPFDLTVSAKHTSTLTNVLVGEVWLCSGQSNMAMGMDPKEITDGAAEIAAAGYPRIRLFAVTSEPASTPQADVKGRWLECSPETVKGFSAVAYFFGRELHRTLNTPVGLIVNAVPGTLAESWISREALAASPDLKHVLDTIDGYPARQAEYDRAVAGFNKLKTELKDFKLDDAGWEKTGIDLAEWKAMEQPAELEKAGLFMDGVIWVRREVALPDAWVGKPLELSFGPIENEDVVYFNGAKVGESPPAIQFPLWPQPRRCVVPAERVKSGKAVIAIRIANKSGPGGLTGEAKDMFMKPAGAADAAAVSLAGPWRYRIAELRLQPPRAPIAPGSAGMPTNLFNGRVAPLTPSAMRGAIWYQGEANAWRAEQYRILFPALIRDWRAHWGQGDFPFLFAQLPNLRAPVDAVEESDWAELREAQAMTLRLPNTGMAVTLDLGEPDNVHPPNKRDVGLRLARWALGTTYGRTIVCSGPLFRAVAFEGTTARVAFDHVGGGLVARGGGPLKGFAVAGADRVFSNAEARIEGGEVRVSCATVPAPVAVRYAWANNPAAANLGNAEGLPAGPFRTDNWPGITAGRK
jgi:sialate O-acetylesterase